MTHFSPTRALLAVGLAALLSTTGCAWDPGRWNPSKLRDDRAVEMDNRLSANTPIVENPFQQAKSEK